MIFNTLPCVNWFKEMCSSKKGSLALMSNWILSSSFFLFKKCNWLTFWRIPENVLPSPEWLGGVLLSQPQRSYQGSECFICYLLGPKCTLHVGMGTHLWARAEDSAEGSLGPQSSRLFKCMGSMFYTLMSLSTPRNGRTSPKTPALFFAVSSAFHISP